MLCRSISCYERERERSVCIHSFTFPKKIQNEEVSLVLVVIGKGHFKLESNLIIGGFRKTSHVPEHRISYVVGLMLACFSYAYMLVLEI